MRLYDGKYPVDEIKVYRAELDVYTEDSNSIFGNEILSYNMAVFNLQKDIDFFGDMEEYASMKNANIRYMENYEKHIWTTIPVYRNVYRKKSDRNDSIMFTFYS